MSTSAKWTDRMEPGYFPPPPPTPHHSLRTCLEISFVQFLSGFLPQKNEKEHETGRAKTTTLA
jgi:hypothetical protein